MKLLAVIVLTISCGTAHADEAFRKLLVDLLSKDPEFKEIELQTPVYEAEVKQGFSKLFLPDVSLHYGHYEQKNSLGTNESQTEYRLGGLNAGFNLFSFGSDLNSYRSARVERRAQKHRVLTQLLIRERDIGGLVLDYLKEVKNVEILSRLVILKEEALAVSQKRFERGSLSEQDFSKVKLDVSNAKAELLVAHQALNALRAKVKAFGAEDLPKDYPWTKELSHLKIQELLAMHSLLTELPQFQAALLSQEASEYQYLAAKGSMFGSVQLNFARNYYEIMDQDQWEWRTSLVYTFPLFDQFDQFTQYRRNQVLQATRTVRTLYQEKFSQESQEVEEANLDLSWKNWVERKESLKISSRLYDSSLTQFNQGKLSVNELFVDQDRLLRTEQIANFALHQLHASILAFCHSRGKASVQGCF